MSATDAGAVVGRTDILGRLPFGGEIMVERSRNICGSVWCSAVSWPGALAFRFGIRSLVWPGLERMTSPDRFVLLEFGVSGLGIQRCGFWHWAALATPASRAPSSATERSRRSCVGCACGSRGGVHVWVHVCGRGYMCVHECARECMCVHVCASGCQIDDTSRVAPARCSDRSHRPGNDRKTVVKGTEELLTAVSSGFNICPNIT
eukprot:scaffold895_cov315-Pinguiococcus_pyrenoidosus.AAC.4